MAMTRSPFFSLRLQMKRTRLMKEESVSAANAKGKAKGMDDE